MRSSRTRRRARRPSARCRAAAPASGSVGPNRDAIAGRSPRASSLTIGDGGERARRRPATMARPSAVPSDQPPPSERRLAQAPPGEPEPGEQARGDEREEPRVGGLERRQQRLRPAAGQLATSPRATGPAAGSRPRASQAIAANARSPCATGGHRTAATAMRIGPGRGDAHREVDRAARPIAEQDQRERRDPEAGQGRRRGSAARSSAPARTGVYAIPGRSSPAPVTRRRARKYPGRAGLPGRSAARGRSGPHSSPSPHHRVRLRRTPARRATVLPPPVRTRSPSEATPTSSRRRFGRSRRPPPVHFAPGYTSPDPGGDRHTMRTVKGVTALALVAAFAAACSSGGASPSAVPSPGRQRRAERGPAPRRRGADAVADARRVRAGEPRAHDRRQADHRHRQPGLPAVLRSARLGRAEHRPVGAGRPDQRPGFESAVAYAVAGKLGFAKDDVTLGRTSRSTARSRPGAKDLRHRHQPGLVHGRPRHRRST